MEKPKKDMTRFEKWLDLLKFSDRYKSVEDLPEEMAKEEGIAEALETMLYSNDNQEYREAMTSYEMAERDRVSDLEATAKKNLEKGIGIGKAEGREEEASATVLRMFNRSYDIATISDLTGLSLDKVQAIIDSVTN